MVQLGEIVLKCYRSDQFEISTIEISIVDNLKKLCINSNTYFIEVKRSIKDKRSMYLVNCNLWFLESNFQIHQELLVIQQLLNIYAKNKVSTSALNIVKEISTSIWEYTVDYIYGILPVMYIWFKVTDLLLPAFANHQMIEIQLIKSCIIEVKLI